MNKKTFLIKYDIILKDGPNIFNKEIKIKNCMNAVHSQIRLEEYLKRKYINFKKLIVHSCKDDVLSIFEDMFGFK